MLPSRHERKRERKAGGEEKKSAPDQPCIGRSISKEDAPHNRRNCGENTEGEDAFSAITHCPH
jgi:hypothetical protein